MFLNTGEMMGNTMYRTPGPQQGMPRGPYPGGPMMARGPMGALRQRPPQAMQQMMQFGPNNAPPTSQQLAMQGGSNFKLKITM